MTEEKEVEKLNNKIGLEFETAEKCNKVQTMVFIM